MHGGQTARPVPPSTMDQDPTSVQSEATAERRGEVSKPHHADMMQRHVSQPGVS